MPDIVAAVFRKKKKKEQKERHEKTDEDRTADAVAEDTRTHG